MKKILLIFAFTFCLLPSAFSQQYGWQDISANLPGNPDCSDVFFVSDNEGWIASSSHAEIYHTSDGGETFEVQTTLNTCNAIHMLNEIEGYAGGESGFIYKTTDGGEHWNFYGTMVANLTDLSFPPNGDTGYACGINGNIWSIDNSGVDKMISNINGNLYGISFPIDSEEGWACGGNLIIHFTNGVWIADQVRPSGFWNAIYMVDTLNGWATGDNGAIICTSDGLNWTIQQTNPSYILTHVFFINAQDGWAVGSGGGIFHTTNGGTNWNIEGAGLSSSILTGVHFTSPTNGYVVGNDKTLLKYGEIIGIREETQAIAFELFPNPVSEKFEVRSSEFRVNDGIIEVYELSGKKVLEENIKKGQESIEIDVNHLESGMYLCKITVGKRSSTKKIVKE